MTTKKKSVRKIADKKTAEKKTAEKKTEEQRQTEQALELAKETLTGDIRDFLLDEIRNLQKPWERMTEDEQSELIDRTSRRVETTTNEAVKIVAANGFPVFQVELVEVKGKGGITGQFKAPFNPESWLALGEAQGGVIQIIPGNLNLFEGQRVEAVADPDQPELKLDGDPDQLAQDVIDNQKAVQSEGGALVVEFPDGDE